MLNDIVIYGVLAASSFINIIVPIAGSSTITPFLSILTDPHRAIGLTAAYFVLSGVVRIFLFRKDIQWQEIKVLLLPSIIAGILGALALITIKPLFLLLIILGFTIYFFLKKIGLVKKSSGEKKPLTGSLIGFLSGFLQGTGLPGSDLRNSYLYSKDLSIVQLHGTTAIVGSSTFFIATLIRLGTNQLTVSDIIPLLYVFPFILIGTLVGRHVLYKVSKKTTNTIIIFVMFTIIVFLSLKILTL